MANADTPMGFKPKYQLDGSPHNGGTVKCAILAADATDTFIGDLVTLTGTASAEGYPSVAQGAATDTDFFGVVTSFDADPDALGNQYRVASTLRTCNVVPALDTVFEVQCDGAFAITDIGNVADVVVAAGSTVTGISAMELNSAAIGGATVNLHIIGFDQRPDNEIGTNANVLVRINESAFRGTGTGT